MKLYERDYIKSPPTTQELEAYQKIRESEKTNNRGFGRINLRRDYPESIRHDESLFPNNHIELFDFQRSGLMESLTEDFYNLIHSSDSNERDVLRFINHTPAYFIVAGILERFHCGHHDAYLFPEFKLGGFIADYLLIGKNSGGYEFIFVELEHPNFRITLNSGHEGQAPRSGSNQIYDWQTELEAHFSTSFSTIIKYSNKDLLPKEFSEYDSSRFHYVVVAGLRDDYNEVTYRDRRVKMQRQNILMLHYDNLYDRACELIDARSF